MGQPLGTANSNILGPCGSSAPLMTALLSLLSLGLCTVTVAMEVLSRAVAVKLIAFSDSSKAGRTPTPWQGIL